MSNERNDEYYRSLPPLLRELRKRNQYSLTNNEAFCLAIFTILPFGFLYFILKRKDQNLNIQAYAKKAILINIVHNIVLCMAIVGVAFFLPKYLNNGSVPVDSAVVQEEEKKPEETKPPEENQEPEEHPDNKKVNSDVVDYKDGVLTVVIDNAAIILPFSPEELVKAGFQETESIANPLDEAQTLTSYTDEADSLLTVTTDAEGNYLECVFRMLDTSSNICGCTMQSTFEDVNEAFSKAQSSDTSAFSKESGYGDLSYTYGEYSITASLENNYVTSISIKKIGGIRNE